MSTQESKPANEGDGAKASPRNGKERRRMGVAAWAIGGFALGTAAYYAPPDALMAMGENVLDFGANVATWLVGQVVDVPVPQIDVNQPPVG